MSVEKKVIKMDERGDLKKAAKMIGDEAAHAHENDEELARSYDELAKSYMQTEDDDDQQNDHRHEHGHEHAHSHEHEHEHEDEQSHDPGHGRHHHQHEHKKTKQVTNRLAKATGHLEKVKRMVEKGEDCTDVLIQLSAVIAALKKTGKVILEDHIQNCIVDAVKVGDDKAIEDLKNAIDKFLK